MIAYDFNLLGDVFCALDAAVDAQYPCALVDTRATNSPAKFPYVNITEIDVADTVAAQTLSSAEVMNTAYYEVSVYSNAQDAPLAEARSVMKIVDKTMHLLGFRRLSCRPVTNLADNTICRLVARYELLV